MTRLEGYRSSLVAENVFGGLAHLMEVGPPTAPSMLLVHGIGEDGAGDFFPILPILAESYHVYAVDLPGFGRSTHGTALYSPENYVRFLHEAIRPRVDRTFALIGHSMGGAISLLYAARYPEDVTRLGLIDVAGILHREALVPFIVQSGIGKLFEPAEGITGALASVLVSHAAGPEKLLENDLARGHLLSDSRQIAAAALILQDFGPAIAELRIPTLVVWGRHDPIAPLRTGTLLGARLPYARLEVLEQSAHIPMETEPDRLAATLIRWLEAPIQAPDQEAGPSTRLGRCDQAQGVRFEGAYRQIEIVGCKDVRLAQVRAEQVRIMDSQVIIESTRLGNSAVALYAARSRLEVTGSIFSGNLAMQLDRAELDVAGSDLTADSAAARTSGPSRILFSASHVASPRQQGYLHGVTELGENQAL
jgi:pimeloyl-ACP methyl ester carboxylesterase